MKRYDRDKGIELFKEVYCNDLGELPPPGASKFIDFMLETLFGTLWADDTLSIRDRRLLLIGAIAAQGDDTTLTIQLRSALKRGELTQPQLPASPLRTGAMQHLLQQDAAGHYALSLADDRTPGTLVAAQAELGARRAALGEVLTQLQFVGQGLQVESANLSARVVPLRDFASAQAATQAATAAFFSAPATARAAQGQPTPESVFKLLS